MSDDATAGETNRQRLTRCLETLGDLPDRFTLNEIREFCLLNSAVSLETPDSVCGIYADRAERLLLAHFERLLAF